MNNPAWKDTESQEKILGNSVLPDPFDEPLPDPNAILSVLNQYESPSPLIYGKRQI